MKQITAAELRQRLTEKETKPYLLDVREPSEFAYCRIEGSVNIPVSKIFEEFSRLDPLQETVVICHHGIRSAQIVNFLSSHGFSHIINLKGGIDAWAVAVDAGMRRY